MKPSIRIRQSDDLELIQGLDRPLFGQGLGCLLEDCTWWVAEVLQDGSWEPVGYCGAHATDGGKYAFLARAGVVPAARGAGLQRRLIRVRTRWAKAHGMEGAWSYVFWSNLASQRSLLREGFLPYNVERADECRFIHFKKSFLTKPAAP